MSHLTKGYAGGEPRGEPGAAETAQNLNCWHRWISLKNAQEIKIIDMKGHKFAFIRSNQTPFYGYYL